ncbi:MAG: ectoine hydroxylase-related dioxygenase (phytanoyl-CoA dioxygenase family) [Arenicella sp.]|jgi:ectoine hydroxylase-related dioxygenase (phytanoyl-CoA dioxygenase family)
MIDWTDKISIFKKAKDTEEFAEKGFVVVPFLSSDEVVNLLGNYKQFYPNGVKGFHTTTFENDVKHREGVDLAIQKVCGSHIENIFKNYQIFFSSFIVKAPGKESELIVHQDMTLLDEMKYSGINIWCPLIDLTTENGAIHVLPKSHRLFKTYRGSSIPDIYDGVVDEVKSVLEPLYLKAGEAVIFDQSIIHYSPPNISEVERPVINTFVAHEDADIRICYWDKENHPTSIEVFEQKKDFFDKFENFGHDIFNRPTIGKSLGHYPYDFPKLSREKIEQEYNIVLEKKEKQNDSVKSKGWIKRMFSRSN